MGGEFDPSSRRQVMKHAQAGCQGTVGQPVCWDTHAPPHISDGGGPTDRVREEVTREQIQAIFNALFPRYHPLALPKFQGADLDPQTIGLLEATFLTLNRTNPSLAADCWLCMTLGTPMPIALPAELNETSLASAHNTNCSLSLPFRVQPTLFNTSSCVQKVFQNNTYDVNVGGIDFATCSQVLNATSPLCPPKGHTFVCGGNMAYTALPLNWTGVCVLATVLPDIEVVPGTEPVPLPSLETWPRRHKRAVAAIPLLVALGVTGGIATGTAGLGVSVHSFKKLSDLVARDMQTLSSTIQDLQDQIDSLAEVVLQNRRGLDLLTAEQGGICLALQERCCFYTNKSGIVRDKIKNLQEELAKRRQELYNNPLWHGILPYLLPVLGPLVTILLALTFGPWAFKRITDLVKQQVDNIVAKPIQVHYHRLAMMDHGFGGYESC